jgi:hypothetical protein
LKANNNLYKSIKDLMREMGIEEDSSQESKYKLQEYESKTPDRRLREKEYEKEQNRSADKELNTDLRLIEIETARKRKEEYDERKRSEARKRQEEYDAIARRQVRNTGYSSSSRRSGYSAANRQ